VWEVGRLQQLVKGMERLEGDGRDGRATISDLWQSTQVGWGRSHVGESGGTTDILLNGMIALFGASPFFQLTHILLTAKVGSR
jgi:hypothetical protein